MARSVNNKPHLKIDYARRWQAQIGPDMRKNKGKKAKKKEPLDPEDDFIADTDPADKPIDEATIDDAMDAKNGDSWVDSPAVTDEWTERLQYADPEEVETMMAERRIYREYAEYFAAQEKERKEFGLPRGITRDMLMQVGMMCDVDFVIDPKTHRAYFLDEDLNKIVLQTYHDMEMLDLALMSDDMSRSDWIEIMVESYHSLYSGDTRYTVLLNEFMHAYGIEMEFSDKGNPVGPYRDFIRAFNKTYKNLYKDYHPETAQATTAFTFSEMLAEDLPAALADIDESKKERSRKAKAKREANKLYQQLYPDDALECCYGSDLTNAQKFTIRDEVYEYEYGHSYYNDLLDA